MPVMAINCARVIVQTRSFVKQNIVVANSSTAAFIDRPRSATTSAQRFHRFSCSIDPSRISRSGVGHATDRRLPCPPSPADRLRRSNLETSSAVFPRACSSPQSSSLAIAALTASSIPGRAASTAAASSKDTTESRSR